MARQSKLTSYKPSKPSSSASKSENKPAKKGVRGRKRKFASYSDEDEQINVNYPTYFSIKTNFNRFTGR